MFSIINHHIEVAVAALRLRAVLLLSFVGSIWIVSVANLVFSLHLNRYGVMPRTEEGLIGFLTAPWLHVGYWHLIANTGGLLILGWQTFWPRVSGFWIATISAMLGAGAVAWLIGEAGSVHIGASGIVFGYAGYLISRGWYSRDLLSMVTAIFVAFSYGMSMLVGVLPMVPGVSWQNHLGGALGGILAARYCTYRSRQWTWRQA